MELQASGFLEDQVATDYADHIIYCCYYNDQQFPVFCTDSSLLTSGGPNHSTRHQIMYYIYYSAFNCTVTDTVMQWALSLQL